MNQIELDHYREAAIQIRNYYTGLELTPHEIRLQQGFSVIAEVILRLVTEIERLQSETITQ
jgi:hypothetical protein